ncbi:hypothetical protein TSAR_005537, partial [Trichomalopsis sarcophagae]
TSSDASFIGWGAFCNGGKTNGHWIENHLVLLAAHFEINVFAKDYKNCLILLHRDSTTAISYKIQIKGVQYKNLITFTKKIRQWCEKRKIRFQATYIAAKDNKEVDTDSRCLQSNTQIEISNATFSKIPALLDQMPNTNVSWQRDPNSVAIVAFTIQHDGHLLEQDYPSGWNLVQRVLIQRGDLQPAMQISLSSMTESPYKRYKTYFRKWWAFVINYTGAAHSSISCYGSAILLLVSPEMAKDKRIKKFFKSLSKIRPFKSKYDFTWDPKIVQDYFSKSPGKIYHNIIFEKELIEIKIPDHITSSPNRNQSVLVLPIFRNNRNLRSINFTRLFR